MSTTINPWMKAWSDAEKTELNGARAKARWNKRCRDGAKFLDATHKYERTFSDKSVGEFKLMGGREAKGLNEKLFEDYLVAMHKNKKGRSLEKWKLVERFIQENAQAHSST